MKGKWKLEYSITIFVILGILLLIMPFSIEDTVQANFISRWNDKYSRLEYMFKAINAHESDKILKSFEKVNTKDEKEILLLQLIKPYLRVKYEKFPKRYRQKYLNKTRVSKKDRYYFDDLYFSDNGMIVGIKDLPNKGREKPIFMLMFDINGILPPNTWGRDIYGINIYEDYIEPFGYGKDIDDLKSDCSPQGRGIFCSYYYKIGGGF